MRAKCGDEKISSNDFITVGKRVCQVIPQLKDKKPPGLKVTSGDFADWVSAANGALCLQKKKEKNLEKNPQHFGGKLLSDSESNFAVGQILSRGGGGSYEVNILCETPTCEPKPDHNSGNYVPYAFQ